MADPNEITARLRRMIENDFGDGDRLPSEVKLSEKMGVSRAKLRESFGVLWQAGLIEKKWGVGTIVRKPHDQPAVVVPLWEIRSAPTLIRESGQTASVTDLSIERNRADDTIADLLSIRCGSTYWLVDRVLCADDIPIQRTIDAVPTRIDGVEFDARGFDVNDNTLVAMYESQLQRRIMRSDGRLTVVPAPPDTAKHLRLRDEDPVLLVEYSTCLDRETPLSYSVTWYNTARVDVRFTAERPVRRSIQFSERKTNRVPLPAMLVSSHLSALGNINASNSR
ncbi:MAG: GntR family transcriptional regulator [Aestuariivita sp.]|nr:GntR family transcriptional regulator [Aestuariivita sp.]MCY4347736.1 GntR family transcriptional regulator [Aestuariivita sp.]